MSVLFAFALPYVKAFGVWLIGVLTRELADWLQKTISGWMIAKQGAQAATTEQAVMNNPASTPQEKADAQKNVLDSH